VEGDVFADGNESQHTFRVSGPQSKANVTTQAQRRTGTWELRRLEVTADNGTKIDLMPGILAREGVDTPKFDPTKEPPKEEGPVQAPPDVNVDLPPLPNLDGPPDSK
jgi:hypothetical protein